jgi:hypothetical protein
MGWRSALVVLTFLAIQTTIWGGDHVRMTVTRDGADLEFDCAVGTIAEPVPDTDGSFRLKGTFTPQRSGPSRGDRARAAAAIYSGTIERDSIRLRVVLEGPEQEVGQFVLQRGSAGSLRKCR